MTKAKIEYKPFIEELDIVLRLTGDLLGTVPKDREVYTTYIESKKEGNEEEVESLNIVELEDKGWTGFMHDEDGPFIYNYMIRGFLKNAGNVLKDKAGVKNLRSKIGDAVFISPRKIHFGVEHPAGSLERPLRAQTMQGPRVTLVRSGLIAAGTEIAFSVRIIPTKEINADLITYLFSYGEFVGLGQWRNSNLYGTFEVVSITPKGELAATA